MDRGTRRHLNQRADRRKAQTREFATQNRRTKANVRRNSRRAAIERALDGE